MSLLRKIIESIIFTDVQKHGMRLKLLIAVVLILLCAFSHTPVNAAITLTDVTEETQISFKHNDGSSGRCYIVETVTAGLALFDYDNDGDIDI